jgi:Gas vesicle synthesis protein GvpL/GvpF
MALLLRAITPSTERRVIEGMRALDVGGLSAWVTELSTEGGQTFTKQDLLDDHRLVEAIFKKGEACLPVRFPTLFADEDSLRISMNQRKAELEKQLEHVRDRCEIALTAVWTSPDGWQTNVDEAMTPGRRYLLERQARYAGSELRRARARALADQIQQAAGVALVDERVNLCPSERVALSIALLVKRADAQQVLGRLPRHVADVRILVNGPWPPYSFVDAGAGSDEGDGRRTGGAQATASARPGSAAESNRRRP